MRSEHYLTGRVLVAGVSGPSGLTIAHATFHYRTWITASCTTTPTQIWSHQGNGPVRNGTDTTGLTGGKMG
jgi:hypothetical protein